MAAVEQDMRETDPTPPKAEFLRKLETQWEQGNFLCVGLDPDYDKIPDRFKKGVSVGEGIFRFNKWLIDSTEGQAGFFKPNSAFFEAHGRPGIRALEKTIAHIRTKQADKPIILDIKRADIGSTSEHYARAAFDRLGVDAVTVNPYLGIEGIEPFLDRADKGVFILARTSNPGAAKIQNIEDSNGEPLYLRIAKTAAREWNTHGNVGLVTGATAPQELRIIRNAVGDLPFLIPGIGAQGGDLQASIDAGQDSRGWGMVINISRGISKSDDPGKAAEGYNTEIRAELAT